MLCQWLRGSAGGGGAEQRAQCTHLSARSDRRRAITAPRPEPSVSRAVYRGVFLRDNGFAAENAALCGVAGSWDQANIETPGLSLALAQEFEWDTALVDEDTRRFT
jgi:hypothetical protein